ncbi:hypothetical protein [Streptosporangium lutulentum]|uniref:Uncharacterized protein n=1 Tax=Streptosporangium lutulentum TaxID=1461250 RepID=A0ABT9QLC1_9ACTN|nr:hypothetical protein [Streptosporangium lutulentum]MDP9847556.1 hypothetical protein [Streptosporangium lutulentum]
MIDTGFEIPADYMPRPHFVPPIEAVEPDEPWDFDYMFGVGAPLPSSSTHEDTEYILSDEELADFLEWSSAQTAEESTEAATEVPEAVFIEPDTEGYDITYIGTEPFNHDSFRKLSAKRPKRLSMTDYEDMFSNEELDALQASWSVDVEPAPDEMEFASFVVNLHREASQNKVSERLSAEFGGSKEKFRKMFHRKKIPIVRANTAWCFTGEYRWIQHEL